MTAPRGRTTVRIEVRCRNMRRHIEAHRFGTPAERKTMPTCPECHRVVVTAIPMPRRSTERRTDDPS